MNNIPGQWQCGTKPLTKEERERLTQHRKAVELRNKIFRYMTAITLYLEVVIINYFIVASLIPTLTLSIGILLFVFEAVLYFGTYYALCSIMKKKPSLELALYLTPSFLIAFVAVAFALTYTVFLPSTVALCIALAVLASDDNKVD
jgi:hypothetical protein